MIQRRKSIKRSTKRIPARRPGKPRRGPAGIPPDQWRNEKYLQFLRDHGVCVVCHWKYAKCDPAHGPVNGRGSKGPDAGAIPLCRMHHDEQHEPGGWPAFQAKYGFDREKQAAVWWAAFKLVGE